MHTLLLVSSTKFTEVDSWSSLFRARGYHVEVVRNAEDAAPGAFERGPSVIIVDERGTPSDSYHATFETLHEAYPNAKMIGISGDNACVPTVTLAEGSSRVSRAINGTGLSLLVDMLAAPRPRAAAV